MLRRFTTIFLLLAILLGICLPLAPTASAAYENTYVNTGNQAEDLVGVAMTQVGYTEGPDNDTKYGDWYGIPNGAWCAMFVSWCAAESGLSTDVIPRYAGCTAGRQWFMDRNQYGARGEYTPKPGDVILVHVSEDLDIDTINQIYNELQKSFPNNNILIANEYILKGLTIIKPQTGKVVVRQDIADDSLEKWLKKNVEFDI